MGVVQLYVDRDLWFSSLPLRASLLVLQLLSFPGLMVYSEALSNLCLALAAGVAQILLI